MAQTRPMRLQPRWSVKSFKSFGFMRGRLSMERL